MSKTMKMQRDVTSSGINSYLVGRSTGKDHIKGLFVLLFLAKTKM